MATSRKRNFVVTAGRLTAITLSLTLLAGCTGARFLMGSDPASVSPAANASAQPVVMTKVSGTATLAGVPMANAQVKVFDALTNAPSKLNATGLGNVTSAGGANYALLQAARPTIEVSGQTFTTDANGNFSMSFSNLKPGMAVRLVITVGGKTLTTLITGSGKALHTSKDGGQGGNANDIKADVNEFTHATTQILWGVNKLAGTLTPDAAAGLLDQNIDTANDKLMPGFEKNLSASDANLLADADEGGRTKDTNSIDTASKNAGVSDAATVLVTQGQLSVAKQAENKNNVVQQTTVTTADFAGSNITVTIKNGAITFRNEVTGETTTITLPEPTATPAPGSSQEPTSEGVTPSTNEPTPNADGDVISNASVFNPTVTTTGTLTVLVSQPAGSEDISSIFARLPKAHVTLGTLGSNLGSGTVSSPSLTLALTQDTPSATSVTLPPRFGSATLSNPLWAGHIRSGTTKIAKFQIFDAGTHYYLVTSYLLTDAIKTNGGHNTSLTTTGISSIAPGTKAEITLVSRNSNTVNTSKTLNVIP